MIWVLLLATAHLVAAWLITTRFLRPSRLCDVLVEWLLLAMTTFYGLPILLGTVSGNLNSYTLLLSAGIALAAGLASLFRAPLGQPYLRRMLDHVTKVHPVAVLLAVIVLLLLILSLALGVVLPVRFADAISYHIAGPIRWLQTGQFSFASFGDPYKFNHFAQAETFPNVKGILPFAIMLWSGSASGTALVQWPYLCLLISASYALFRRLQISHSLTFTGILICITAPEVLLQSLDGYADVVYFAATVATLWIILKTVQDGASWSNMVIAAMSFSQLAGSKSTGFFTCGLLGLFYLGAVAWPPFKIPGFLPRIKTVLLALALVVTGCLAIAGPWYLHALAQYDNPIYPIQVSIFGTEVFSGYVSPDINANMVEYYTKQKGIAAWWGSLSEQWRPPTFAAWNGGLGAAFFIVGIPCSVLLLVVLPVSKRSFGTVYLLAALLAVVITSPAPMLARFTLPYLALAGLSIGFVGMFIHESVRFLLIVVVLVFCGYNLYVTAPSILHRPRPPEVLLYNLISGDFRSALYDRYGDEYTALDYWHDKVSSADFRIVTNIDVPAWHLFDPSTKPDIQIISEEPDDSIETWTARAVEAKATHVFFSRESRLFADAHQRPSSLELLYNYQSVRAAGSRERTMPLPVHGALFRVVK